MGWFDGWGSDGNSDNTGWNMNDWWSSNDPYSSPSNWLDNAGYYSYMGGDANSSGGNQSGINWGNAASSAYGFLNSPLGGALLAGGAGWLQSREAFQNAQDMLRLQAQLAQQNYAANKAVDEQYYQLHGKQLTDALGNYSQYYRDPTKAENNPTNIFGLLTPKPTTGPLANGW